MVITPLGLVTAFPKLPPFSKGDGVRFSGFGKGREGGTFGRETEAPGKGFYLFALEVAVDVVCKQLSLFNNSVM